jgi:hypothetical protein
VNRLETELKEALDKKAKAIARAQLTRSGVEELGDASVPFPFDVHAIIYCEDAPALETKLHQAFAQRRVNAVNYRKEYFRVSLDEIQTEVQKLHGLVTFRIDAEAEDYRKSLAAAQNAVAVAEVAVARLGAAANGAG